jgi:hypothetical protein
LGAYHTGQPPENAFPRLTERSCIFDSAFDCFEEAFDGFVEALEGLEERAREEEEAEPEIVNSGNSEVIDFRGDRREDMVRRREEVRGMGYLYLKCLGFKP